MTNRVNHTLRRSILETMAAEEATIDRFCRMNGLNPSSVSALITGKKSPYCQKPRTKEFYGAFAKLVADALGMSCDDLYPASCYGGSVVPEFVGLEDVDVDQMVDPTVLTGGNAVFEHTVHSELKYYARIGLSQLSVREERVVRLRFGIGEKSDHTLEEAGAFFEVTRERVLQIEAKALRKLRAQSGALGDFRDS